MRQVLNDLTIRSIATDLIQLDVWDAKLPCFGVRVTRRGTKTFILKTANRRYSLGRYPYVSLKDARDEARKRIALKYLPAPALPARTIIERYIKARTPNLRPSSLEQTEFRLRYFPNLQINQASARKILDPIQDLAPAYQNVVYATFKTFLNWCVENEYITVNPLAGTRTPHRRRSRTRLITDDEMRRIWPESFKHDEFGSIIRCLILSGQRLNQIARFNPAWIRDELIIFPAAIMKNNQDQTLPLTQNLRAHLEGLPLQFKSYSGAMRKFRGTLTDVTHFTLHDFRRYFSSTMAKLSVPIDVTEALLAHTSGSRNPIQRTYDRYDRLLPKRSALEQYENYVLSIVEQTQDGYTR